MEEEAGKEHRGPLNRAGWEREVMTYITIPTDLCLFQTSSTVGYLFFSF